MVGETKGLVTIEDAKALDRPATVASLLARRAVVEEVVRLLLKPGVHYRSYGSPKPGEPERRVLGQTGAQLLCNVFGIAPEFIVEDISGTDEIRYRVTCRGSAIQSSLFLGSGVGECSSSETKYRWERCYGQKEFDSTPDDRKRLKWKSAGKTEWQEMQIKTNPADKGNTILKMAAKRAGVAMTTGVIGCGDMFETARDDEDEEAPHDEGQRQGAPPPPPPAGQPEPPKRGPGRPPKAATAPPAPAGPPPGPAIVPPLQTGAPASTGGTGAPPPPAQPATNAAAAPAQAPPPPADTAMPMQTLDVIQGPIEEFRPPNLNGWWAILVKGKQYLCQDAALKPKATKAQDAGLEVSLTYTVQMNQSTQTTWLKIIGLKVMEPGATVPASILDPVPDPTGGPQ